MRLQDLKNIGHFFQSLFAVIINGYPAKKIRVIGVTGTDGKTTVVNLIYHLLKTAGKKVGMISTVGAKINSETFITTGLHTTTPSPFLIQRLLKKMVNNGYKYAVIEVTSHALDQHRVFGCNFEVGVITNISHEHLDYHKTIKNYLLTKLKLLKNVKFAVINNDDINLKSQISNLKSQFKNLKIYTYGLKEKADLMAKDIEFNNKGTTFTLYSRMDTRIKEKEGESKAPALELSGKSIKAALFGEYNVSNILAAICVAKILGVSDGTIKKAISNFKSVKGRMEEVKLGQPFSIFIDFGHTPQAFGAILPTIRKFSKGRIIHVFGATGRRDKEKRPIMGEISGKLSDLIILTTEDTYGEDEEKIINSLEEGVKKAGKKINKDYWIEKDRQKAINKAVSLARKGDTIIITGVGHQTAINKGKIEIPWSEYEAIKKALNLRK